jgi:hypothetical protein
VQIVNMNVWSWKTIHLPSVKAQVTNFRFMVPCIVGPTLVRMSVNCWTDTAGRCYPMRLTAPTWVSRTSTCSQNWKSTCVVCISQRWRTFLLPLPDASDSSTVLKTLRETGIMNLPKRWEALFRQKGGYTEGL